MMEIKIARSFSRYPGGRYISDGPYSGEFFRKEFLEPALRSKHSKIIINIDGIEGLGSSFIDEAFGGLAREGEFRREEIDSRIDIICSEKDLEFYVNEIYQALRS